jgi:hypothetical protein
VLVQAEATEKQAREMGPMTEDPMDENDANDEEKAREEERAKENKDQTTPSEELAKQKKKGSEVRGRGAEGQMGQSSDEEVRIHTFSSFFLCV